MSHPKRRNRINEQFSPRLIEMLESPAYRALSKSAHMVVSRVEIEFAHHGGNDNGRLPVTVDDFVEYGMHRTSVAPAIREAEALGFIRITEHGRGGNAEHGKPNLFFLTFAHGRDSGKNPPTHDWRRVKTKEQANEIARVARATKTRAQSSMESGTGVSGRKDKRPVRKIRAPRYRITVLKASMRRYWKAELHGQSNKQYYILYLG